MFRRWLLRGLAILFVVACPAAWVRSYFFETSLFFTYGHQCLGIFTDRGLLYMCRNDDYGPYQGFAAYDNYVDETHSELDRPSAHYFLGFLYDNMRNPLRTYIVGVPFWFLTVVTVLVLFYVWRRTRHKPNPATAFPVEMKASGPT